MATRKKIPLIDAAANLNVTWDVSIAWSWAAVITFPTATSTLATLAGTETLTNKTLWNTQLWEASLKLDATLSADGTWSGITVAGTGWATLSFWQLCYFKAADSLWYPLDWILDGTDVWFKAKLGMCVLAWASTTTEMLLIGKIRADAISPTFTIGAAVYADDTSGNIVVAQPTTTNFAIRIIGYADTADVLMFNPSHDYIVHV